MNAGARIRAENNSNSEFDIFVLPTIDLDLRRLLSGPRFFLEVQIIRDTVFDRAR